MFHIFFNVEEMAPRETHSFLLSHHYACVILSVFVFMLCPAGGIVPSYAPPNNNPSPRLRHNTDADPNNPSNPPLQL